MRNHRILLIILLTLVLASCGSAPVVQQNKDLVPAAPLVPPSQESKSSLPENPIQLGNTPEVTDMPSTPPPVEKFVDLSKKDLANRLQLDIDKISLTKTEEIIWPDSALGCPAPGKVYAQGKVPGFQIWLQADDVEYTYHTDWVGQVILCFIPSPEDGSQPPDTTGPTPQIGVPID